MRLLSPALSPLLQDSASIFVANLIGFLDVETVPEDGMDKAVERHLASHKLLL
jgi:hypothetical protein